MSTVMGMRSADQLLGRPGRHAVAVIGDGAFPSGIVFEAMNNVWCVDKKLLVILNDNKMSICPRVGGWGEYLDRLRANPLYTGLKEEVVRVLNKLPGLGDPVERFLAQVKEAVKAGLHGGMLFEELGFRYIGPVDGHNIGVLRKYLKMVKGVDSPVLLHVVTEKGHGYQPAASDPVYLHSPPALPPADTQTEKKTKGPPAYTDCARDAILHEIGQNDRVTVLTAAMCQGNKLEPVREKFPDRFFDTGICEAHTVAFAAGQAKAGLRPIVTIYSTFLQRSFDQIFQEVALQNLPVTFLLDRAGLTGPDGPTHHGMFDLAYLRVLPNLVVMAPGDGQDIAAMLAWALAHDGPCSIRYPKATAARVDRPRSPLAYGRAEVLQSGHDLTIVACGTLVAECLSAADQLAREGLDVGVINARFVKPLDQETILEAVRRCAALVTVEEAALAGGFGSAVLEAACAQRLDTSHIQRIGVPDQFIQHGERAQLLTDLKLDAAGIAATCLELIKHPQQV